MKRTSRLEREPRRGALCVASINVSGPEAAQRAEKLFKALVEEIGEQPGWDGQMVGGNDGDEYSWLYVCFLGDFKELAEIWKKVKKESK